MVNLAEKMPASRLFPLTDNAGARYSHRVNGGARFSLRLPAASIQPASEALGIELAMPVNCASVTDSATVFRLGPDEWLLLLPEAQVASVAAGLEARLTDGRYSLVDISHRQTGVLLEGAAATDILNGGCPLDFDLAAFPVGMATRTIFFKAEIVLWRQSETQFHLEVWRSFAPYVWDLLGVIGREYGG